MILAMAAITTSDALVKGLLTGIRPFQFIFVRALVILVILALALRLTRRPILIPSLRQPWALARGGFELMSTGFWLTGLQFIALPTAATLAWTSPIMVTLLGILILRESAAISRWLPVLMGFGGVLCVTQPWGTQWNLLLLLPLGAALASASRELSTRFIDRSLHPLQIAFVTVVVVALGSAVISIFQWQSISFTMAGGILVSALLVSAAFPLLISAVRLGEISFISPFFFTAIPFSIVLGYLFWGDTLNFLAMVGVLVIIGAGLLTVRSN